MKKILVPIDFSPASHNASECAAALANVAGAEIHLLHVYKDIIPATVGPEPWTITVSELQKQKEALINKEIIFLKEKYSVKVNGEIKRGFIAKSINKTAKEMAVDLVIIGMKIIQKRKILSSNTLKATLKTNIPVLIIPEEAAFSPMKNIVLAVDFNEIPDGSCFDPLFRIIKLFDAWLRVLHVEKKGADINASEMPGKLQLGLDLAKVSYSYDKIENNDIDLGIQHFVQNHPTDLLVMVAHHHNIFERLFGSVHTWSICLEAKLPLLVLKNNE